MIELRYMTEKTYKGKPVSVIDEVCADECTVHLEDLGAEWMLTVDKSEGSILLHLPKLAGRHGDAVLFEAFGVKLTKDGKEVAQ